MFEWFAAVNANHALGNAAAALSSLFWTATYLLILRRAHLDRIYGMPLAALGANLAWEATFLATTLAHGAFDRRLALLLPWTALDVGIAVQCFRYGAREFANPLVAHHFRLWLTLILVTAAALLLGIVHAIHDAIGWYTAFGQNFMMSALFVAMLLRRDNVAGQSLYIALCKLLGSLFAFAFALFWSPPTLHEHWRELLPASYTPMPPLLGLFYAGIFTYDLLYVALVARKTRELGLSLWRRF